MKTRPVHPDDDLFPLDEFIGLCEDRSVMDSDGHGCYSDGVNVFIQDDPEDLVKPSQILKGNINRNYSHVVWYNK